MAKTKISEWSTTPASNTDIDGINIAEGCAPSGINDAIRDLMAQVRSWQSGASGDPFNGPMNGTIGATTAYSGAFTTVSATGVITSTLATGTAPFTIASTTKVTNLNADLLDGADWASPAALGSTTPAAVSATTLSASGTVSGTGFSNYLASPPAIGGTAAAAGSFTTLTTSSTVTLNGGTANGVTYLNGSKVLTSGSALTFDGTNLGLSGLGSRFINLGSTSTNGQSVALQISAPNSDASASVYRIGSGLTADNELVSYDVTNTQIVDKYIRGSSGYRAFYQNGSEGMRLTSTGLGIGTSSPAYKLDVSGSAPFRVNTTANNQMILSVSGTAYSQIAANSSSALVVTDGGATGTLLNLTQAGNLGLGVTPNTWYSGTKALEIGATTALMDISGQTNLYQNGYLNAAGNVIYKTTNYATQYRSISGQHQWFNAPSGTAGTGISFTQAMTLDASGNLLVGNTTDPLGSNRVLVQSASTANNNRTFSVYNTAATSTTAFANRIAQLSSLGSGADVTLQFTDQTAYNCYIGMGSGNLYFATNGTTERARIDSSGNLLVGTTSATQGGASVFGCFSSDFTSKYGLSIATTQTSGTGSIMQFVFNGTQVGSIANNSVLTAYNTTSDYRLKNSIAPMTGALAKVVQLKPCTYKWNVDGSDGEGFIAHELAEVVPQCVTGEKDAVNEDGTPKYQSIDTSFLVATLTAAIQEQQAIIESLKARLDAANL